MKKGVLILLMMVFVLIIGCAGETGKAVQADASKPVAPQIQGRSVLDTIDPTDTSREGSQKLVEHTIRYVHEYKEYQGSNLRQISVSERECDRCWTFVYEFDIDSDNLPQHRKYPDSLKGFRITMLIDNGNIGKIRSTELTE